MGLRIDDKLVVYANLSNLSVLPQDPMLRHSHATDLLRQNVSIEIVSKRLGHASIETTKKIYEHFKLNTEIKQKNIFEEKNLNTDVIVCRAFKPLPVIFEIAKKNFRNYKYIILYLGRSGKKILKQALKLWQFDYEEKKSLTNDESIIVKIYNLKKK